MRSCILLIFLLMTHLNANFSGEVGTYYKSEEKTNTNNSTKEIDFTKFIGINYIDYIYDPNLLSYDLRTKLEQKDIDFTRANDSNTRESKDYQYDLNMHFFQQAYFPFTVYSKKITGELTNVASSISARNIQDTITHGVNGHVELESSWVDYLVDMSDIKRENFYSIEDRKTQKVDMTAGYRFGLNESKVNFQHSVQEAKIDDSLSNFLINNTNQRDSLFWYLDGQNASMNIGYEIDDVKNKNNDSNFLLGDKGSKEERYSTSYMYRPSQFFSLSAAGSLSQNPEHETTNEVTTLDTYWQPSDNLSITNNMFRISNQDAFSTVETYNYNIGATYLYNESLTFLGTSNSYFIQSFEDSNVANNSEVGFTYIVPFADEYLYTLNANVGAGLDRHSYFALEDKMSYSQRVDNLLTFKFDTHKMQLDIALNLYNMDSTLGEKTERLMFSTDLMGYPIDNFRYLLSLKYINNMDKSYYTNLKKLKQQVDPDELGNTISYDEATDRLYSQNNTERQEGGIRIDYSQMVGSDGKLFLGSGIKQTQYIVPETKKALSLYADATFNYRIFGKLFYKLRGNVRNDSLYGTNEYILYNEMSYTFRQMKFLVNNEYWNVSGGNRGDEQQIRTMLRVSREF